MRRVSPAIARLLTCLLAILAIAPVSATAAQPELRSQSKQQLERLKLAEEVDKLRNENAAADGWSGFFADYAPLLTALVAAAGVLATILKGLSDQNAQRTRDRTQRHAEDDRRREDRFAAILGDLGSDTPATKAGAAASLVTYLEPKYARFHHQVRVAVLTNLKLDYDEPIRKLLARVYVQALRTEPPVNLFERDLSRAKLAHTDLSAVDLPLADLAFADLKNSILVGADLYRARGRSVNLEGARLCSNEHRETRLIEVRFKGARCRGANLADANLVNAHLEEADLRDTRFYRCRLQAAHLEGARLEGAQFQEANIADTYFLGAQLDLECMKSIARAVNWRKAHFDQDAYAAIQSLAANG